MLSAAAFSAITTPTSLILAGYGNPESARTEIFRSPTIQGPVGAERGKAILRQAETDFGNGRFEEAFQECNKALELNPNSAEAYYLLGLIQDRRGAVEEARQALRRSVELDPRRVEVHIYLGQLYLNSKQLDGAEAEFQSAVKLGDDAEAEGRFGLALVLVSKSQYKEALPYLTAAVDASPNDLERLLTLTMAEVELNRLDEARTHLKQIETLSPENPEIAYRLGVLFFEHHMPSEAEAELERAARLLEGQTGPRPPSISPAVLYLDLAQLRFKRKDYWQALRELSKIQLATLSSKDQAQVLRLEARVLVASGKPTQAVTKIRQVTQRNTANAEDLIQQAWAELLSGDVKAARDSIAIARTESPDATDLRQTAALVEREALPPRSKIPLSQDWHLKGEGLVCCPCKVPCPCRSNALSSEGHCETAGAFRIDRGHYGDIRLDGFLYVALTGAMDTLGTPLTLFVERTATDEQLIALERIYQAFDPLHPLMFLAIERLPISFSNLPASQTYEVEIPGRVHLKIRRQLDENGRPLMQTAALDHFSNTIEYVQNVTDTVWDKAGGLQWDFSHRQANLRFIDLDGRDYQNGMMLVQFYDYSGFFNQKQLELIKTLNLPMLSNYPRPKRE